MLRSLSLWGSLVRAKASQKWIHHPKSLSLQRWHSLPVGELKRREEPAITNEAGELAVAGREVAEAKIGERTIGVPQKGRE